MDLRDVGLLGKFLRGREAALDHQERAVHLHRRLECTSGAVRVIETVRVRSPDSGRQLKRSGLLITGVRRASTSGKVGRQSEDCTGKISQQGRIES